MRVASPVNVAYHLKKCGWRSRPRSARSSLTRQSGVPLGTSSHTRSSIGIGEFSTRHANDSVPPAPSRATAKTTAVPMIHLRIGRDSEQPDQIPRLRTDRERTAVELADRLDAED